ncbi:uncharacterized protein Bfra_001774 [Botrytis fragariae]|uniref:Uncharacterized protein n=1 Tax=Botrytis fragariae TaxID=1964551 RepID=A0A8H6B1K8_9HELO|nr:uncharacterized protein Bfra_001774 [Botrytis fragariae]KAF5877407.1 hypothetical protein Bfra_001774 [Botrytis fragariae]
MDESRKLKPTVENTNPYLWEMQLLTQEFNEREANSRGSLNDLADQASLQQHNVAVAKLEDRKRRAKATVDADRSLEIDIINKKYGEKSQALEADYTKKREDLEMKLFKKSGHSYKRLQELHAKNLLQIQEFEEKAKDILQRMSKSLKEENAISTMGSNLAISVTATGAIVDTPPTSSAGESTMPVSRTERVIKDEYLMASPDDDQSLFVDSPEFEPRVPPPMEASLDSHPLTASLGFRPSPNDDHSIKHQKTKELPSTSIKRESSPSMNDASYAQDLLSIHAHQSYFPSTTTAGRYCNPGKENETILHNGSMSPISVSTRLQPAHAQQTLVNSPTLNVSSGLPASAQFARRGYSSSQISRPLISAPRKTFSNAGLTDNASSIGEKQCNDYRQGQTITPLKRKASGVNLSDLYDDMETSKAGAPTQIQQKSEEVSRVREVRRSATNASSASGAGRNWIGQTPQFGRQEAIKEEPTSAVTSVSRYMNPEPAHMPSPVHQPSNVEAMQSRVLTPRHSNVGSSRRTTTGTGSFSSEPSRPLAATHKLSVAEARLSFGSIPIEYISYDAGTPSRSFPVTWSGTKGSHNYRQQVSHNFRLQVMLTKNKVLHPYDGADDKSSQYPKLVVDDSWVLGGFYHKESGNYRIEIYRPRSKREYRAEFEEGHDRVETQSARLRIEFAEEVALNHFLQWYEKMHPNAEINPDDRLGSLGDFHDESGKSDPVLREKIEKRAQRFALVAPVAVMTSV